MYPPDEIPGYPRAQFIQNLLHESASTPALAGKPDRVRVLKIIRDHLKKDQRAFVGGVAPT